MTTERVSYDPTYFAPLFAIEERHFWFHARSRVVASLVNSITPRFPPGYRVLEVGCGTGYMLRVLERCCHSGIIVGMDLFSDGLRYARERTNCDLVVGDVHALPFVPQRFHLVGLFDVLEHFPDDSQILVDLSEILAPEGVLMLTVQAHPSLWSYFDEASHHSRRYTLTELESKLVGTGYQIEYLTQWMMSLFPLVWLGRRVVASLDRCSVGSANRVDKLASRELRVVPVFNDLMSMLLALEERLIARRRRLPIGTSLLAIARKKRENGVKERRA